MSEYLLPTPEAESSNLIVCNDLPGVPKLISEIRSDRTGGQPLRDRFYSLGQIIGGHWLQSYPTEDNGVIIGIPRSGIPMSKGLSDLLPDYQYFVANGGAITEHDQPNYILIVDSVIVTGTTIKEIVERLPFNGEPNKLFVISAVSHQDGISRLLSLYPNLKLYVGEVETEIVTQWDPHCYRLKKTIPNIGDIGRLVSID